MHIGYREITPTTVADNYFIAWKYYDFELLNNIFTRDAKYIISNKKRVITGIEDISKYWKRNKDRQKNIKLTYRIKGIKRDLIKVIFQAKFYDIEENQNQTISGYIMFKTKCGKISKLEERYVKLS